MALPSEGRVPWVDYAKGICIILVVMLHTTNHVEGLVGQEGFMHYAVMFARPFRMPDFFVISGLFLSRVIDRDWRTYSDRKVVHFAYFYVLWIGIFFAVKSPLWIFKGNWDQFMDLPLAFVQPLGTMWFIYLLPIFFVVTKLLREWKVSFLAVWIVAALLETARVQTGSVIIDEFCARWVYFLTGYLVATRIFAIAAWVQEHVAVALAGLVAWSLVNGFLVFGPSPFASYPQMATLPGVSLILGFAGALAVISTGVLLQKHHLLSFVRYCGQNSIVIYLAFFLTLDPLKYLVPKYGLDIGWGTLGITVVSVIVPLLLFRLVNKTRFDFLFKRPAAFRIDGPVRRPPVAAAAGQPKSEAA